MSITKNRILLLTTIILLITLSVGCKSNNKFDSSYKQFKESYILATDFVNKDNDSLKALKKMNVNLLETELKKMKEAMDSMSTETNSKDGKGIYGNVKKYYDGLEFLLYANKNFDKLSVEEKMNVDTEIIFISMTRKSIKNGEQ